MHSEKRQLRFTPAAVPTFAAMLAVALTGYLGHWQQGRAEEKRSLQAEYTQRSSLPSISLGAETRDAGLRYRMATARGVWQADRQIYVDNKFDGERVGYHVITPLKISGTDVHVLVNRGWIARSAAYPVAPSAAVTSADTEVSGSLTLPSARFIELGAQTVEGNVWQNLTVERYQTVTGLNVLPYVLLAGDSLPPLRPVVEQPDAGAAKHVEYMLTWYSLAATVTLLWLFTNIHVQKPPMPAADSRLP